LAAVCGINGSWEVGASVHFFVAARGGAPQRLPVHRAARWGGRLVMSASEDAAHRGIEELIEPELNLLGFALVELELLRGGGRITLRVSIEKSSGETVDVEDCAGASKALGRILDAEAEALLPGRYVIEVSSPGIFRRLRKPADYVRYVEQTVKVVATQPDGSAQVRGRLAEVHERGIVLVDESGESYELAYEDIRKAHLDPDLEIGKSRKGKARH
jgi:ribosome maturation factor RimP